MRLPHLPSLSSLIPHVPHAEHVAQKAVVRLQESNATLSRRLLWTAERARAAERTSERLALEMAQIKGSLNRVSVYEGMVESSPTATLVAELVADHQALEQRIDNVVMYLRRIAQSDPSPEVTSLIDEVQRLVQGGPAIPDDASALLDG